MFPPAGTYSVPVMKMKRRILILPVLLFALALLRFPQEAAQAVREGLLLCFETVVPSLFPFFVVVSLLTPEPPKEVQAQFEAARAAKD